MNTWGTCIATHILYLKPMPSLVLTKKTVTCAQIPVVVQSETQNDPEGSNAAAVFPAG